MPARMVLILIGIWGVVITVAVLTGNLHLSVTSDDGDSPLLPVTAGWLGFYAFLGGAALILLIAGVVRAAQAIARRTRRP